MADASRRHDTTSPTLLARVRDASDQTSWREFEQRYSALIRRYCRRLGLKGADIDDAQQVALLHLARGLPSFEYDPARGRFRDYLGRVVRSAISRIFSRKNPVAGALPLDEDLLPDDAVETDDAWEREWASHHYRLAMETVRVQFEPRSLTIFDRLLAGESAAQIADSSGVNTQVVHQVKHRIKTRLQELIARQIQEEDEPAH